MVTYGLWFKVKGSCYGKRINLSDGSKYDMAKQI